MTWVKYRKGYDITHTSMGIFEHYMTELKVLDIKILDRKACDKKLKGLSIIKMGPDRLCAGSNALNKSPCKVRGWSINM